MKSLVLVLALAGSSLALADVAPPPPVDAQPPMPPPAPAAVHPEGIEKAIPTGVIQGGWGYVYACYALAIGGTLFYAVSLRLRRPRGPEGKPS